MTNKNLQVTKLKRKISFFCFLSSLVVYDPLAVINMINKKHVGRIRVRNRTVLEGGLTSLLPEIVEEVFYKKVYTPKFLSIQRGDTVVDIGANIGAFGVFASNKGAGKIFLIEPHLENRKFIRTNFKLNKIKNYVVAKEAVAGKSGWAKYYLRKSDAHGGIKIKDTDPKNIKWFRVKTQTLDDFFSKYKLKKVDFLKMDCEGAEGEIVLSTKTETWKKVDQLVMEYHNDLSTLPDKEISRILVENGFTTQNRRVDSKLGYVYAWRK